MRKFCFFLLFAVVGTAVAQTNWLNVYGDSDNPNIDSIEVDPIPLFVSGNSRIMRVRANRGTVQKTAEGVPYRSFEASVLFDCDLKTAEYISAALYMQATWQGPSHKFFSDRADRRPMDFTGAEPNPKMKLIRAACIVSASNK